MIRFEQTLQDLMAFNDYYLKKDQTFIQKYWRWGFLIILFIYVFVGSGDALIEFFNWDNWFMILFIAVMLLLWMRLMRFIAMRNLKSMVKNNPQSIGERQIDFNEEQMIVKSNVASTEYKYTAFIKVVESDAYYFAFVGKQSGVILPKRTDDKAELKNLIEKIKKHIG